MRLTRSKKVLEGLSSMTLAVRLVIAFVLPPTIMLLYSWSFYELHFSVPPSLTWTVLLAPTLVGAIVLGATRWPVAAKVSIVFAYIVVMLGSVTVAGLTVAAHFGEFM